jgi:hypothetical protein
VGFDDPHLPDSAIPNPGAVTLPRPRSLDMMADPRFVELTQTIRRHFNDPKID